MRNDLRDFEVHKIKPGKEEILPATLGNIDQIGEVGYAVGGHQIEADNVRSCCKTLTYGEGQELVTLYFVRIGIRGFMYNPWNTDTTGSMSREARTLGRSAWEYKRVSKKCFDYYYQFICSHNNEGWLRQAEREVG